MFSLSLAVLSVYYIVIHLVTLCIIRPRDCLTKPCKYFFSLVSWLAFYHTLHYMSSIHLAARLCSFKGKRPLLSLLHFFTFWAWLSLQTLLLLLLYYSQQ